ncbi:MAG: aminotransferase class V-fold PLP-dependent enzyme, partial [Bacteroidaceae bacterium]|nr:aminotransferase class V-fold PLP-dependent enzyme [Bacteroidaceae bacterium]
MPTGFIPSSVPQGGADYSQLSPDDGALEQLSELIRRHYPEEHKESKPTGCPRDELNLEALRKDFEALLEGRLPQNDLPYFGEDLSRPAVAPQQGGESASPVSRLNIEDGFGIGIPENQKLRNINYEEADTLNSAEIKKDFPVLQQKVNGHDLVWLDNGATTQKPVQVIDKISDYYRNYNSNIHRGAHTLAARATDAYEAAREKVQHFINAGSPQEIIFVRGTTEGINLVAQAYGRQFLTPGDEVIVSELDHHANIVPWQRVCQEKGCTLKAIPTDANGDLVLSELERLITPRTRFVSVGHVNNTFGTINDVQRIIDIAHSHNIPVLIDGAQSIAHTPVDVQQMGADFFVFSGHKIYGPNGIGAGREARPAEADLHAGPQMPYRAEPRPAEPPAVQMPDPGRTESTSPTVFEMLATGECGDGAGILEIHPDGYGFLRTESLNPGKKDVYVSNAQIRRFNLRSGDLITGKTRPQREGDRYSALLYITQV